MSDHTIRHPTDVGQRRAFTQRLIKDLQALERMLERGQFETGIRRIGAEQELVLVDKARRPALCNLELLDRLGDDRFTTELSKFNIEFNLEPLHLRGDCLSNMERQLDDALDKVRRVAKKLDVDIVQTGILPTLEPGDLRLKNITPLDRYRALNEALMELRGGTYPLQIKGIDDLNIKQASVMLEACNTSFQVHFQLAPDEFPRLYNIAQAVSAPVLAAASNSPLLFGHRLWAETRIAVFQSSVDSREAAPDHRRLAARVTFGNRWIQQSAVEIYREDVSRLRVLFAGRGDEEDPFEILESGGVPRLEALQLHNGTVYRWNRPCYGITNGKPHLRIENRYLPAGPTTIDQTANAAFWFGLLSSFVEEHPDITAVMDFDDAKANFMAAARHGLAAQFTWLDGKIHPAQRLICRRLIPMAREGLKELKIDDGDIDKYLTIVHSRVKSGKTGARWLLASLGDMKDEGSRTERLNAITTALICRQQEGKPVHRWKPAQLNEAAEWRHHFVRVGQYMTTDLFTVNQDEVIDLVANMMDWEHIRHVPVEDNEHRLVGLVSYRALLRFLARNLPHGISRAVPVSEIMKHNPITVTPDTTTLQAIQTMRRHKVACLPVTQNGKLVGIVTEHDLINIAASMLEHQLKDEPSP